MEKLRSAANPSKSALILYHALWSALDLIYPPVCGGCEEPGSRWCDKCYQETEIINQSTACPHCGKPKTDGLICNECVEEPLPLEGIRSWAIYDGRLRQAIHSFKYQNNLSLGEVFSRYLINLLLESDWKIDLIVPVPISLKKFHERGYNQSNLLSRPIAMGLGIRNVPNALRKLKNTPSQVDLNAQERRMNLRDAFWADPVLIKNKRVLIIDDVITTGSTLRSCAEALLQAGTTGVFAATLARPLLQFGDSA